MDNEQEITGKMYGVGYKLTVERPAGAPSRVFIEFDTTYEGWENIKRDTLTDESHDPEKTEAAKVMIRNLILKLGGNKYESMINPLGVALSVTPNVDDAKMVETRIKAILTMMKLFDDDYNLRGMKSLGNIPEPTGKVKSNPALRTSPPYRAFAGNEETQLFVDRVQPATVQSLLKSVKDVIPNVTDAQIDALRTRFNNDLGRGR